MDGMRTDLRTGATEKSVQEFGASGGPAFKLADGSVPFVDDNGVIRGDIYGAVLRSPGDAGDRQTILSGYEAGTTGYADWSARVSSVAGANGFPSSTAGTLLIVAYEDGTEHYFSGAFLAPLVE